MKKITLTILLALTAGFGKLTAQTPAIMVNDKAGWHKIGEKTVDFTRDRDEIVIIGADRFSTIKVKITEASITLYNLEVHYDHGDLQVIKVRDPIKDNGESPEYDLKGTERDLKKVVFVYKTVANRKEEKAHVELWGLKINAKDNTSANTNTGTSDDINPVSSVTPSPAVMISDKAGWHKIGERKVDFARDRDEIMIVGADRFAAIKFKVTEAPIDLQELEVYYESGVKQDIPVRTPILSGNESRVIDLNGGERNLKKIVFVYKTLPNQKEQKAHVEVWGLKTNIN